jgi:quercetin dioxygenase-like cupin family protein
MKRAWSMPFGLFLVAISAAAFAQDRPITVKPENVQWSDLKEMPGWKQAVLAGDPTKPGPYVQRIKLPPNALVPPHSHPDTENITVLAGAFGIGTGTTVDKANGQVLGVGSFYLLPANTMHFAWAGPKGATLQIHGVGPSGMTMAGPAKQ